MEVQSLYFIAGKFRKFRAHKFCDSEKFAKFSLREMFSPKWDKANFFFFKLQNFLLRNVPAIRYYLHAHTYSTMSSSDRHTTVLYGKEHLQTVILQPLLYIGALSVLTLCLRSGSTVHCCGSVRGPSLTCPPCPDWLLDFTWWTPQAKQTNMRTTTLHKLSFLR